MRRLDRMGRIAVGTQDLAEVAATQRRILRRIAQSRRGEDARAVTFGHLVDGDGLAERRAKRFVDVADFSRAEDLDGLPEMQAAVVRLEQHAIDLVEQFGDRRGDLYAELLHGLDISGNAVAARPDCLRSVGIGRNDLELTDERIVRRTVEQFGKGGGMRRIEADDADTDHPLGPYGEDRGEEACDDENLFFHGR